MSGKKRFETGVLLGNIELTEKQKQFHKVMTDWRTKVVLLSGPAGSAKTFLSTYCALDLYNQDKKLTISYIRTIIESASKGLGFLKGSIDQKVSPYLKPLEDKISEILSAQEKDMLTRGQVLSGEPINFIRGQDWKNKVIIADEMQNATIKELLTIMTRLNKNSTLYICGDKRQSDIRDSGFDRIYSLFNDEESKKHGIHCLEFGLEDIMRDPVVGYIIDKIDTIRYNQV